MVQKNSILYEIDCEAMKVWANAYCQNSFPGQEITLKSLKSSLKTLVDNIQLHEDYWRKLIVPLSEIFNFLFTPFEGSTTIPNHVDGLRNPQKSLLELKNHTKFLY